MPQGQVDGLISGLSTGSLVTQLLQLERQPQLRLSARRDAVNGMASTYQTLNSRLAAVRDAATALATPAGWAAMKASPSVPTAATASASATATPASLSFTVDRLATNHSVISVGSTASTSTVVATPGSKLFLARAGGLGLGGLTASAGLADGAHTLEVTQASAGATQAGSALGAAVTVGAGLTLDVAVDGTTTTTHSIALAAGTHSRAELADMVASASGGLLRAEVTAAGGLALSTLREGTGAHLAVTGGTGLGALGLSVSASADAGADGVVKVDGTSTTVTDTAATVLLDAGGGHTLTATFSGGLRLGSVTAKQVSVGDGTLASVVTAVNSASVGMTAAAFQVAPGAYRLQVASTASGAIGSLSLDPAMFAASLGVLETLSAGTDAQLTVGAGATAVRVRSATNTFSDILPGTSVSALRADPAQTISVNVTNDPSALAERVAKLVEAVNGSVSYVKLQSQWNPATKTGGPLLGDAMARSVESEMYSAVSGGGDLKSVGLSVTKEGFLSFDRAAFTAAYEQNPVATSAFFHDGGTAPTTDDGLGQRLAAVATRATDSVSGIVTGAIAGRKSEAATLDRSIAGWDVRLARREETLRRQFTGLETALSKLRNQSSWLSGQLAGLTGRS